jgi:hypothetical protein
MHRETVYVETGRSRPGVSTRTGVGFLLGEQKSTNSVVRWMFNTNQRTYQRKREVWMCNRCGGHVPKDISYAIGQFIGYAIVAIVVFLILIGLSNP